MEAMYYDEKIKKTERKVFWVVKTAKGYLIDECYRTITFDSKGSTKVDEFTESLYKAKRFYNTDLLIKKLKEEKIGYECVIEVKEDEIKPKGRFGINYKYQYKEQ